MDDWTPTYMPVADIQAKVYITLISGSIKLQLVYGATPLIGVRTLQGETKRGNLLSYV
jgi:hypothetical protein